MELTYWAWAPNMDKVVDIWNKKNPNIHVTVNKQDGGDPAVTKLLTAVKAGNGARTWSRPSTRRCRPWCRRRARRHVQDAGE